MPNWCSNTLKVHSTNEERLKEFKQAVLVPNTEHPDWDPKFTFNNLYPTPAELMDENAFGQSENSEALEEKYGASDWYTWRVSNWGTKWDAAESGIVADDNENLIVWFDTAWAPPVAWLEKIAPQFPELNFSMIYDEPGCDFCGIVEFENGECTGSEQGDYIHEDPETGREVKYNNETEKWHFTDTNETASDDESYWPEGINPYGLDF
jgi:hypothetical protein